MPIVGADAAEVAALRVVERVSLYAIEANAKRKDGSPFLAHEICHALYGVTLRLADDLGTSKTCDCAEPPKLCGTTHIGPDGDAISLLRLPPAQLCYAHEALHYAQHALDGEHEAQHEHWLERGYYAASDDASRRIAAVLP